MDSTELEGNGNWEEVDETSLDDTEDDSLLKGMKRGVRIWHCNV
jgi:hypothetical protein